VHASPSWRLVAALVVITLSWPSRPSSGQTVPLEQVLRSVGGYVENYLGRVQTILSTEKVIVQPLARDLSTDGRARTYLYEMRLDPGQVDGPAAVRVRDLVTVDGRQPRQNDLTACLDHLEPLEFLRPEKQAAFDFTPAGTTRMDGRPVLVVDFRGRTPGPVQVVWTEHCGRVELPGRTRGRLWVDPETAVVLRLQEAVMGQVDLPVPREQQGRLAARVLTLERADTEVRFRPVRFTDPDETIYLPERIETLTITRNGTAPRIRTRHEYSNYRRFVTGGRVLQ